MSADKVYFPLKVSLIDNIQTTTDSLWSEQLSRVLHRATKEVLTPLRKYLVKDFVEEPETLLE